jgi:hypothetical protein
MAAELTPWPDYCRAAAGQLTTIAQRLGGNFRDDLNPMQDWGRQLAINNITTAVKMLDTAADARWTAADEARWSRIDDAEPPAIVDLDHLQDEA